VLLTTDYGPVVERVKECMQECKQESLECRLVGRASEQPPEKE
jgi:hypothetical protein